MVATRPVTPNLFRNYLQKAEECLESARDAFARSHWNSTVINAIHCGICAADALTVFFQGERCTGERHADVLGLLKEIESLRSPEFSKKLHQLALLLDHKNRAEYEEHLMSPADAESAVQAAERLLVWVKNMLKI